MADKYYITIIIQDFLFTLILLSAFIYSYLILFIRRFHHRNNIFILNICFTIISTSIFFLIFGTVGYFDPQSLYTTYMCLLWLYAYNIASIEIPFSFVTFAVHRFCSTVYHTKPFFKTKRWVVMCIASQWIGEFIISLPFIFRKQRVSINS
jgi:hypothetical protein